MYVLMLVAHLHTYVRVYCTFGLVLSQIAPSTSPYLDHFLIMAVSVWKMIWETEFIFDPGAVMSNSHDMAT